MQWKDRQNLEHTEIPHVIKMTEPTWAVLTDSLSFDDKTFCWVVGAFYYVRLESYYPIRHWVMRQYELELTEPILATPPPVFLLLGQ